MRDTQTPEAAKAHIEQIRYDKGLNDGHARNQNAADLERALKIVSDELYHKSTHFLLELIQNADDNVYHTPSGIKPTLDITLYDDHLRVDCNEIGFSAQNVDAICKIGNSTKAGTENATRYVGEKGIGFKSVFKVADVVYITSRSYSFKFEKNGPLGMIAPVWTEFPIPAKRGYTTFYLHLLPNCNRRELLKEILALDPRMLIFLRQLRQININIEVKDNPPLSRALSRLPDTPGPLGSMVTLRQDFTIFKYLVFSHQARQLPREPKREGLSASQVLLAFPVADKQPKLEPQQVYAFLPIRDYGFQFLLQADFLLIASREDVDDSSEWNRALRNSAIDALVETAKSFNTGPLKYTWPRYLPGKAKVSGFFTPFKELLVKRLATENLLENCEGRFVSPRVLIYCPKQFCDPSGRPLTLTSDTSRQYLSPSYDSGDYEGLSTLGVQEMNSKHFLSDLRELIRTRPEGFHTQALEWHSNVAKALIPLALDKQYFPSLATLKLIPLRDGRWVSVEEGPDLFFGDRHGLTIPEGVNLMVVDPAAAADSSRESLFSLLGVANVNISLLCRMIVKTHNSPRFDPFSISEAALLSQAIFLYNARWKNEDQVKFWCVDETNGRLPAHKLYLDCEKPHSAKHLFANHRSRFRFVHPSYLSVVSQNPERWQDWLHDGLNIATHPRLGVPSSKDKFEIAPDFAWIMLNRPSTDFLLLLRDQWGLYQDFIENDDAQSEYKEPNLSRARIRKKLASTSVKCRDGRFCLLGKTFLPTDDLVTEANGCVPFLDVPDPQDRRWRLALRPLEVGLKNDLQFYLQALKNLKRKGPTLGLVSSFLEQIQARSSEDILQVKKCFQDGLLVYIPLFDQIGHAIWVAPQACVWDGPKCLRTVHALKELYPQNQKLFCDVLGVQDAKLGSLIQETRRLSLTDDLPYITNLFTEIEKFIKDETLDKNLLGLRTGRIFPIRNSSSRKEFDQLLTADSPNEWFIADCSHFQRSFKGKIPLLAFDVRDIGRMKRLLRKAGVENRRLSAVANGTAQTIGNATVLENETRIFKDKVNSILRLIPDTETNRMKIFQQLRAVELSKAPRVIQNWSLSYNGQVIQGEPEDGHIALNSDENALHIYFTQSSMGTPRSNSELVEKLSSFCGFDKGNDDGLDRKYLLLYVVTEPDQGEIESLLDKHRVPPLFSDDDLAAENERNNKEQLQPRGSISANTGHIGVALTREPKFDATHTAMAGLAEKIPLGNIRVFTVNDEISSASNANYFLLNRSSLGLPSAGSTYLVNPGANQLPGMENIHVLGLRRTMLDQDAERIAGLGGIFVSKILQTKILGKDYNPEEHWTSKHRSLAGYSPLPFEGPHSSKASFTIDDSNGVFTKWLTRLTESAESWQAKPPTYHLEVKATKGGLGDEFKFQHAEFLRARRYRTPDYGYPTDVSILVRVWNIESNDPQMTLFVDTWAWYMADKVLLQALDGFRGSVLV